MMALSVIAFSRLASVCSRGATQAQFNKKPPTVAGKIQSAGNPQAYAAPLTPSRVQAEEELAEALIAATQEAARKLESSG